MNPGDTIKVIVEGQGAVTLGYKNYKASGGEGMVLQKGGTAYKIMHPGKQVIPRKKLQELGAIKSDNVLIPTAYINNTSGVPIGFTMNYIHGTESLCKLFNIGFRQQKGLGPNDIIELVKALQLTLIKVHEAQSLVVDFNQMNFLVDGKTYVIPYFIDTDSYQTPSFPATALMECVRDRISPKGKFTQYTDWFSWACVTFWLYTGLHPYRGSYPGYSKKDWNGSRMDDHISVFHKGVSVPSQMQDLSVIPKAHLEWFKEVFVNKGRSIPPLPEGTVLVVAGIRVKDVAQFSVIEVAEYDSDVRRVFLNEGTRYVLTKKKLWVDKTPIFSFPDKYNDIFVTKADGCPPVLAALISNRMDAKNSLIFIDWKDGRMIHRECADDAMTYNGTVYSRHGNVMTEHNIRKMDNPSFHTSRQAITVFGSACQLFTGVAVQDMLGKCILAIPNENDKFVNINVKELDGVRVISAKFEGKTCVLIGEKNSDFKRFVVTFSHGRTNYHVRITDAQPGDSADFLCKPTGLCISPVEGDDLETWAGDNSKVFKDGPIPAGSIMYGERDKTMFCVGNKLYETRKK